MSHLCSQLGNGPHMIWSKSPRPWAAPTWPAPAYSDLSPVPLRLLQPMTHQAGCCPGFCLSCLLLPDLHTQYTQSGPLAPQGLRSTPGTADSLHLLHCSPRCPTRSDILFIYWVICLLSCFLPRVPALRGRDVAFVFIVQSPVSTPRTWNSAASLIRALGVFIRWIMNEWISKPSQIHNVIPVSKWPLITNWLPST